MSYVIKGRVWVLGENISTDYMAPSAYQWGTWEDMKPHVLEPICPEFPKEVREGDIIIAGRNFACGSSREKAPRNLHNSGIRAIVAGSFGRIFFRSSIAIGLPVLNCSEAVSIFKKGDLAIIDVEAGTVTNETTGKIVKGEPLSSMLVDMLKEGGLLPLLKRS